MPFWHQFLTPNWRIMNCLSITFKQMNCLDWVKNACICLRQYARKTNVEKTHLTTTAWWCLFWVSVPGWLVLARPFYNNNYLLLEKWQPCTLRKLRWVPLSFSEYQVSSPGKIMITHTPNISFFCDKVDILQKFAIIKEIPCTWWTWKNEISFCKSTQY